MVILEAGLELWVLINHKARTKKKKPKSVHNVDGEVKGMV